MTTIRRPATPRKHERELGRHRRLKHLFSLFPALKRWAKLVRPSGGWIRRSLPQPPLIFSGQRLSRDCNRITFDEDRSR